MSGSVFRVTDAQAPRRAADPGIELIAGRVCEAVRERTPVQTGRLQAGWKVVRTGEQGERAVENDVPYARFVEYGTVNMAAEPMIGPVLAEGRA